MGSSGQPLASERNLVSSLFAKFDIKKG